MKNAYPFYTVFQVLNIHYTKICKIEPEDLLFLVVFISFYISRYIIFHKFLELHSILSVKKIFFRIFFFNGFTQPPPPSTRDENFCRCPLKIYDTGSILER